MYVAGNKTGAIFGGVVGGCVLLLVILALCAFGLRARRPRPAAHVRDAAAESAPPPLELAKRTVDERPAAHGRDAAAESAAPPPEQRTVDDTRGEFQRRVTEALGAMMDDNESFDRYYKLKPGPINGGQSVVCFATSAHNDQYAIKCDRVCKRGCAHPLPYCVACCENLANVMIALHIGCVCMLHTMHASLHG